MIPEWEIILRLLLAAVLGAVIGWERELHNQPAGLRTHTILVIGSALAMSLSINLATGYRTIAPNGDPARLAAQVISGIGFLGAGAILRYGPNVKGLTTATSLWTMAVVGLAVGGGFYPASIAATVLLLITLTILDQVEKRYIHANIIITISVRADDRPNLVSELRSRVTRGQQRIETFSFHKDLDNHLLSLEIGLRVHEQESVETLVSSISEMEGIHSVKVAR